MKRDAQGGDVDQAATERKLTRDSSKMGRNLPLRFLHFPQVPPSRTGLAPEARSRGALAVLCSHAGSPASPLFRDVNMGFQVFQGFQEILHFLEI